MHWQDIRRAGGICVVLAGLGLLMCAFLWPAPIEHLLRSRLAVALLGVWCVLLHPRVLSGLGLGLREFLKETRKVAEEVRRKIDGDDDNGPQAV